MKRVIVALVLAGCSSSSSPAGGGPADAGVDAPVTARANGTLGAFETLAPMPAPRGNHCAVATSKHLVVIGGNSKSKDTFVSTAEVHVAAFQSDGSLGPWQLAGKTPSPVNSCTAAADGDEIWILDGIYDDETLSGKVRHATLGADGALGAWQDGGALAEGVRILYSNATIEGGILRAFHARLPNAGDDVSLVRAPVGSGKLGPAVESPVVKGFRGHPQHAFVTIEGASYAYALGGYDSSTSGNKVLATGNGAALDASGGPTRTFDVSLPKPTAFGEAVAVDDWIFLVGGKEEVLSGKGRAEIYAAKVDKDGTIGAWTSAGTLPQGRTALAVVAHDKTLYVLGGGYDAGGVDTVFAARVRF